MLHARQFEPKASHHEGTYEYQVVTHLLLDHGLEGMQKGLMVEECGVELGISMNTCSAQHVYWVILCQINTKNEFERNLVLACIVSVETFTHSQFQH